MQAIPTPPENAQEEVLRGGRLTPGVVRIGATVRRPASAFTAILLRHLDSRGFAGAPKYLGRDEQGRDMLAYIDGWVPARFQYFTDSQVRDAAMLLKAFHDATRGSGLVRGQGVICHHDAGPNNTVFQHGRPVAFIDVDMASEGDAIEDVGYMAWTWCVSSKPERGPASRQAGQVRILADAYGLRAEERLRLVDAMLERQARNIRFWSGQTGEGTSAAQIGARVDWSQRELAYTEANRAVFMAALLDGFPAADTPVR